jgi:hypothetical protein
LQLFSIEMCCGKNYGVTVKLRKWCQQKGVAGAYTEGLRTRLLREDDGVNSQVESGAE